VYSEQGVYFGFLTGKEKKARIKKSSSADSTQKSQSA
jgi:hypothetical protein